MPCFSGYNEETFVKPDWHKFDHTRMIVHHVHPVIPGIPVTTCCSHGSRKGQNQSWCNALDNLQYFRIDHFRICTAVEKKACPASQVMKKRLIGIHLTTHI